MAACPGESLGFSLGVPLSPLTMMMLPFFFVVPFLGQSVVCDSLWHYWFFGWFSFSFLLGHGGGGSSAPPSFSATCISFIAVFTSHSLPRATTCTLHRHCSQPFTLQKVSGATSSGLGVTVFFTATMDSESFSAGQQKRQ